MPHGVTRSWWHQFMEFTVSPHWLHRDEHNPDGTATRTSTRRHALPFGGGGAATSVELDGGKLAHILSSHGVRGGVPVIVVHDSAAFVPDGGAEAAGKVEGGGAAGANGGGGGGVGGEGPGRHITAVNHVVRTQHQVVRGGGGGGAAGAGGSVSVQLTGGGPGPGLV